MYAYIDEGGMQFSPVCQMETHYRRYCVGARGACIYVRTHTSTGTSLADASTA